MGKNIKTAVIATAGWGTRWMPITKSIEKCMLPIGTRPVIDWIVSNCVDAGIEEVIIIVGESHGQIRQYFGVNHELNEYLVKNNKHVELDLARMEKYKDIRFKFVVQDSSQKYGTAIPLSLVSGMIEPNEPFLYFMGDDFVYRKDGKNEVLEFIKAWQSQELPSALMTSKIPKAEASKYGVVISDGGKYQEIIEKPAADRISGVETLSINISKYIFNFDILRMNQEYIDNKPEDGNEYYITDVLNIAKSKSHDIFVHSHDGEYLDAGNPKSWLRANNIVLG